ncbi:MAG: sigma-54 dependent transcriptional regulator [Saprospiraceae bacterium]|nr:sigma-54 dependent transcriptional regulator [Saprospiraceae bacterium]MCF8248559.1 sigma-54 dependent transcriptional regulator [Saprospiraceae bacterium]MCF8280274.1 sigma-54 dependent transcriptional regulator [Bacteroidales bacterium]MCF8310292.1 sigma-54 dependent transcriptional regulator [Saprospiraceae bacterium]MCF8439268.1 sigma-54 dependent transcriptional regulator [Saprospiraceae bacterium]
MKQPGTILILDDEEDILFSLKMLLKPVFARVFAAQNPEHLPRLVQQYEPDVLLLDLNFHKGDSSGKIGLEWLQKIKELRPQMQVVIITAHGEVEMVVHAMKLGATDFIEKPWRNEKLLATVKSALNLALLKQEVQHLSAENKQILAQLDGKGGEFLGESPVMKEVFKTIEKVAKTDANVLVTGENGTGKELTARELHRQSTRGGKIFVNVDLGAISESLFESELFGYVKGAFTDAKEDHIGKFEAANGGTLFLDEIGNLSLNLQAKLLAVLQSRKVVRVGSTKEIPVDFRLICATNSDLKTMVAEKTFRQDLLYRINTIEISMPPLRERVGDIRLIAKHYLDIYSKKYRKSGLGFEKETQEKLEKYPWHGNVRELRHAIERAVIMTESAKLQPGDFLLQSDGNKAVFSPDNMNLEEIERSLVQKAIEIHQGNISKAAESLGLTRAALYRRLEKFGL